MLDYELLPQSWFIFKVAQIRFDSANQQCVTL